MQYKDVLNNIYHGDFKTVPDRLLCLDPGETTGWALFEKGFLTDYGQIPTIGLSANSKATKGQKIIHWGQVKTLFDLMKPSDIVCEDYRIYAHKLQRHTFSDVQTLRLIGGIDLLCTMPISYEGTIPITYQMAVQAKGFITDDRLKDWDLWKAGMKHSRDAIRHGLYFLLITNRPKK